MRRLVVFLLFSTLVLSACGKKDSGTGPSENEISYIPFDKVGNSWTYNVSKSSGEPATTSTMVVLQKEKYNGVDVTVVKESEAGSIGGNLFYYQLSKDNLLVHRLIQIDSETGDSAGFDFDPAASWLSLPLSVNKNWQVFSFSGKPTEIPLIGTALPVDSSLAQLDVEVQLNAKIVKEEEVEVGTEKFDAYQVDFDYIASVSGFPFPIPGKLASFWVVPYVGIARIVLYDTDGSPLEVRVLTAYSIK